MSTEYDYSELIGILDSIMADYGNNEIEMPEHLQHKSLDDLTEEECKEVFVYNGGDEEECLEYYDEDEI